MRENFIAAHDLSDEQRMARVATQALDELQDFIDEATHDPWPGHAVPPRACAEVRDGILHLWYGHRDDSARIVLSCQPIPLELLYVRLTPQDESGA